MVPSPRGPLLHVGPPKFARDVVTIKPKKKKFCNPKVQLRQCYATTKAPPVLSFKSTNLYELHSSLQAPSQQSCFAVKKKGGKDAQIIYSTSSAPRLVPWLPPPPGPIKFRAMNRVVSLSG